MDSGKSTFIGRLLMELAPPGRFSAEGGEYCRLLDSFEEERNGNLTIDTTQATCCAKGGLELLFIDVPGHQELIQNMLCGSSYADFAVIIIDSLKSLQTQTKRHAWILKFLGIKEVIIAVNKMDAVGFDHNKYYAVKEQVEEFASFAGIKIKAIIPVSAKLGDNLVCGSQKMPWYKGAAILGSLKSSALKQNRGPFRFPVQDVYGSGRRKFAVGQIVSGQIRLGEKVVILPENRQLIVRQIRELKNKKSSAFPRSPAIMLNEMEGLYRGQLLAGKVLPLVGHEISARIFCVKAFRIPDKLTFQCLSRDTGCRIKPPVKLYDGSSMGAKPPDQGFDKCDFAEIDLETDSPVVIEDSTVENSLKRFVLRNEGNEICAVGRYEQV